MKRLALSLAVLALLASACAAPTATPAPLAATPTATGGPTADITLTVLSGRVEARAGADAEWQLAAPTQALAVGSQVKTYAVSTARLDLPGGSRILIEPATELALTVFNFDDSRPDAPITQLRVDILRGEAAFDVVKLIGPDSAFVVFMPTAVFAARGDEQTTATLAPKVRLMPTRNPRAGFSSSTVNLIAGDRQVNLLLGTGRLAGLALNPASGQLVPYRFELDGDPDRPYGLVVDLLNPPISENGQVTFDPLATAKQLDETAPELLAGLTDHDAPDVDLNLPESGGGESGAEGFFQTVTLSDALWQQIMARLGYVALGGSPTLDPGIGTALFAALLPGMAEIIASGDDDAGLADWLTLDDAALQKQLTDSGGVFGVAMGADRDFIFTTPGNSLDEVTFTFTAPITAQGTEADIFRGDGVGNTLAPADPFGDVIISTPKLSAAMDAGGDFIVAAPGLGAAAMADPLMIEECPDGLAQCPDSIAPEEMPDGLGDFILAAPRTGVAMDADGDFILATLGVNVAANTNRPIAPLVGQTPTREGMVNVFLAAFEGPHPEPLFDGDGRLIGLQPPPQVVVDQNRLPIGLMPAAPLPAPEELRRAADPRSQYVEWVSQAAQWLSKNQELALEEQNRQAIELLADDVRHAGYYEYSNSGSDQAGTRQPEVTITQALTWGLDFAYEDVTGLRYQPIYNPVSLDAKSGALRPTVIRFGEDGRFTGFAAFDVEVMRVGIFGEGPTWPAAPQLPGMVFNEAGELTGAAALNFLTYDAGGNAREWIMPNPLMFDENGQIAGYQPAPFVLLGTDGQSLGLAQPNAVFLDAEMADKPVVVFDGNGSPRTPEQSLTGEAVRDLGVGELAGELGIFRGDGMTNTIGSELIGVLYWGRTVVWDNAYFAHHETMPVETFSVALPDESGIAFLVTMYAKPLVDERGVLAAWQPPPIVVLNAEGAPEALAASPIVEQAWPPLDRSSSAGEPYAYGETQSNFAFVAVYAPGVGVRLFSDMPGDESGLGMAENLPTAEPSLDSSGRNTEPGIPGPTFIAADGTEHIITPFSDEGECFDDPDNPDDDGVVPSEGCTDIKDADDSDSSGGKPGESGGKPGEGGPPPGCAGDDSDRFRPECSKGDQLPPQP